MVATKNLITLRRLSQDSNEGDISNHLSVPKTPRDSAVPMRIVSQQHPANLRLFDQLMGGDNLSSSDGDRSSSLNAIDKLNLLEEDDEDGLEDSEWNEPQKTVFNKDAAYEESKINHLIQQADDLCSKREDSIEEDDDENSSCSSGESEEEGDRMTKGKNLKQLSMSQTDKLRAMLAQQRKSGN